MIPKISANILIRNEVLQVDGLIQNLLDADVDELVFLDGGSTDGTYEKLVSYEETYEHIIILRWPQPSQSEYKCGFREKDRRNLMMQASNGDYVLYIDADERIDVDFKEKIKDINVDVYAIIRWHFWNEQIRINMQNDKVWSPELQFRIVKNDGKFKFASKDANGLHNYLSKHTFRLYNEFSNTIWKKIIAKFINACNGINLKKVNILIYHLHYYDVKNGIKVNDLRQCDFEKKALLLDNIYAGLQYDFLKEKFICCFDDGKYINIIKKYIN